MTNETRRARTAFIRVGIIAPLVLLGLSIAIVLAWMPQLPDPVAIHWSGSGPDGFAPQWMILFPALLGIVLVLLMTLTVLLAQRVHWSPTARFMGAMSLGLGVFMAALTVATAGIQRGLTDATDASDIGVWMFLAFGILVVASILGWLFQPHTKAFAPATVSPQGVQIAPSDNVAWFGEASMARSGKIVLSLALATLLVVTVVTFALDVSAGWFVFATFLFVLLAVASSTMFRVRVDSQGLQVRSFIGWPNTRIPLDEISKVEIAQIDPFAEFGGWGWRISIDTTRRGVVLRKGEALQVSQGESVFVVTVDGASEAAAVLEGLRAASR